MTRRKCPGRRAFARHTRLLRHTGKPASSAGEPGSPHSPVPGSPHPRPVVPSRGRALRATADSPTTPADSAGNSTLLRPRPVRTDGETPRTRQRAPPGTRVPQRNTGRRGRQLPRGGPDPVGEPLPRGRGEPQHRPVAVLRVAHRDRVPALADLDATAAVRPAAAALTPPACYSFHLSPALFSRSSIWDLGTASARRCSNMYSARPTSLGSRTVMPCTPVSRYAAVSDGPTPATANAPDRPPYAAAPSGTTWIVTCGRCAIAHR